MLDLFLLNSFAFLKFKFIFKFHLLKVLQLLYSSAFFLKLYLIKLGHIES